MVREAHLKCRGQVVLLAFSLIVPLPAGSEETLANPFGGRPPDYGPALPDEPPLEYWDEIWVGNFLGHRREIHLSFERFSSGISASLAVNSYRDNVFCHYATDTNFQGKYGNGELTIPENIGGCWRDYGNDRYDDLGGSRYGPIFCVLNYSMGNGSCLYIAATSGKKYRFSVRGP